jgi:hypothetical protein
MGPAQERLDPDHAPAGDVDLRLVMDFELVALERMGEITLQRPTFALLGI